MIVLGKDLVEQENVMNTLDYILRKNIISWNAIIVTGEKSAVETLKGLNKLEEKSSMGWQSLYNISERGFDMVAVKVRDFAKGVYGLTGTSLLPIVEAKDTPPENQGGSSGSSDGGGGGSSGGSSSQGSVSLSENDCIFTQSDGGSQGQSSQGSSEENKGQGPQLKLIPDTLVFFRGKKIARLNKDQTEGINWLSKKALFHSFTLENIGGYYFKDSKVSLSLKNQKIKIKSKFDSNPTMDVKIDANFTLVEVMRSDIPLIAGKHDHVERSELLSKKINDFIEKQVRDAFETGKEKDADVFNFVPYFFKFHNKQYNKYMSTGRKVTDLLKDIELKLDIKTDVEV